MGDSFWADLRGHGARLFAALIWVKAAGCEKPRRRHRPQLGPRARLGQGCSAGHRSIRHEPLRHVSGGGDTVSFVRAPPGDSFTGSDQIAFGNEHVSRLDTVCNADGGHRRGFQRGHLPAGLSIICSNLAELQHRLETCAIPPLSKLPWVCRYIYIYIYIYIRRRAALYT
jgi:hypothetical protein